MPRIGLLALALCGAACFEAPPTAPADLDSLYRFLFREYANEDPAVLADGLSRLETLLAPLDLSARLSERSYELLPVQREDLAGITWPQECDPAAVLGVAVTRSTRWPVQDHARFQAEGDMLASEPTAKSYERTFPGMDTPACFADRSCAELVTANTIMRANLLMSVTFVQQKRFRWVRTGERWSVLAKGWLEQIYPGDDGTALRQSYAVDVFLTRADGTTVRSQANWAETVTGFDDREATLDITAGGIDGLFEATDEVLAQRYHGE